MIWLWAKLADAHRRLGRPGTVRAQGAGAPPAIAAATAQASLERHGGLGGRYLGVMVFGALDGILTTFAVVSGVAGADLGSRVVAVLGLATLLADAFGMAIGAYLSVQSEREYYQKEKQREAREVELVPEVERAELYEIYRRQGYSEGDARSLVEIKARNPQRWVEAMMVEELGLLEHARRPLASGLAVFVAFVLAGIVPLIVYLFSLAFSISSGTLFLASLGLSAGALFSLGAAKVVVTKGNPLRSGLETLVAGGLAAGVAYGLGALLNGLVD